MGVAASSPHGSQRSQLVQQAAAEYLDRGWAPVPVPYRSKNPGTDGWQNTRMTTATLPQYFPHQNMNIGVMLGELSGGLTDIDLDTPESIAAAPFLLPQTERRFGRATARGAHWLYVSDISLVSRRCRDPDGTSLAEVRASGREPNRRLQTLFPPSVHPNGESIEWEATGDPATVDGPILQRAVASTAAAAMLARRWCDGSRHDLALALSGALLRGGMPQGDVERFVEVVARVAGDEEWQDRVRAVKDTAAAMAGSRPATGMPRLAELLKDGPRVVTCVQDWLGLNVQSQDLDQAPLCVVNLRDFLGTELAPREALLRPWLPCQGLAMVYALRGIGKSWFALMVAYAIATGGAFLKWTVPYPRRVLLLDGEMPASVVQARLAAIVNASELEPPEPDYFRLVTPDLQEHGLPDLSTKRGQALVEWYLDGVDLVIVDNISTFCRTGIENEAESWLPVQGWALQLRRSGRSVLFVHHAGKGGAQRGTSRREDVLDTVIGLRRPNDYHPTDGARFEVHFEKHRGFYGADASPFEAALMLNTDDRALWTIKSLEDRTTEQVAALSNEGMSQRQIANELGIGLGTVNRHKAKAAEKGLLHDGRTL